MSGWPLLLADAVVVAATVIAMEAVAWASHRFLMHGRLGWRLHRDHHEAAPDGGPRLLERNDLYSLAAAAGAVALFVAGAHAWPLTPIAIGVSIYGLLYVIVHDGLVHQRWPFRHVPRRGYLKRLYQAHLLHHATQGREGAVSFGFLYAPPVRTLRKQLSQRISAPSLRPADHGPQPTSGRGGGAKARDAASPGPPG